MSGARPLGVRIAGTASATPGERHTTAEIAARVERAMDAQDVERKTGIRERHFARPDETCGEIGAGVLGRALERAGLAPEALRRIVFVSSLGGDVLIPATANRIAAALGLASTCDCFDVNNACSGFLTALDLGARSVATGSGPVGIVVVDLPSRYVDPSDPRPFLVFGDGAAAAVLTEPTGDEAILATYLRNDGTVEGDVSLGHPGLTGRRETIRFPSASLRMVKLASGLARQSAEGIRAQTGIGPEDAEWVLIHQPNGPMLDLLRKELHVPEERVVPVVEDVGSVGSASIPISLDRLVRSGRVKPGERVFMVSVGAGLSCGAVLYRA